MFVNLVVEIEARNIAQRYAIYLFFFVLNSVRMAPQQMENFSRLLEMMQCKEHKHFAGTERFLKAEPLLKMCSTAEAHRQHSTGKRTCSIWSNFNSQNDCWWSEHEQVNRSFDAKWRTGDEKHLCQDGAQESHRATAVYAVGRSFWHPNALRWCRSLHNHLISHLATSFLFQKVKSAVKGHHVETT